MIQIMIIRAMNLVNIYFKDKKDKGGNPYTEHLNYIKCYIFNCLFLV